MTTASVSRAYAASFVVAGIALNVIAGRLAALTGLPGIYLDLSGTLLTALILGPWWAATTGLLSNLVTGLIAGPVSIPFGIVNMAFGLVVGFLADKGWTKTWIKNHSYIRYRLLRCLWYCLTNCCLFVWRSYWRTTGHNRLRFVIYNWMGSSCFCICCRYHW